VPVGEPEGPAERTPRRPSAALEGLPDDRPLWRLGGVALVKEASAKEGNPQHPEVALAGHAIVRMSAGSGVPQVLEARPVCRLSQVELGLLIEKQKPAIGQRTLRQRQMRRAAHLPHAWDSA